jgi:hypothetical protein
MGFMAGFGQGFSQSFNAAQARKHQREQTLLASRLGEIKENKSKRDAAKAKETAAILKAKAIAKKISGAPADFWTTILADVQAGLSDSAIMKYYEGGTFTLNQQSKGTVAPAPTASDPAVSVEEQMQNAVPVADTTPTQDVTASAEPAPESQNFFGKLADGLQQMESDKVDNQIKATMGEEAYAAAQEEYTPITVDSGKYSFTPKEDEGKKPKYKANPTETNIAGLIFMAEQAGDTEYAAKLQKLMDQWTSPELPKINTLTTVQAIEAAIAQVQGKNIEGAEEWLKIVTPLKKTLEANKPANELSLEMQLANAHLALQQAKAAGDNQKAATLMSDISMLEATLRYTAGVGKTTTSNFYDPDTGNIVTLTKKAVGGELIHTTPDGQRVVPADAGLTPLTEAQTEAWAKWDKFNHDVTEDHTNNVMNLAGASILGQAVIESVIDSNGGSMTIAADAAQVYTSIKHEFSAIGELLSDAPPAGMASDTLRRYLPNPNAVYTSDEILELARNADTLESKIGLLAFQIGSAYGTSGTAMSNKDLAIFMKSLIPDSKNPVQAVEQIHAVILTEIAKNRAAPASWKSHATYKALERAFNGNPPESDKGYIDTIQYLRNMNIETSRKAADMFSMDTSAFMKMLSQPTQDASVHDKGWNRITKDNVAEGTADASQLGHYFKILEGGKMITAPTVEELQDKLTAAFAAELNGNN